jgi:hypothetical protein
VNSHRTTLGAGGAFGVNEAKEIARWLFVDNPKSIFKLDV